MDIFETLPSPDLYFGDERFFVEVRFLKFNVIDAHGGGWIEADPKKFYFVEKRCKEAAEAVVNIHGQTMGSFVFWYENESTILKDMRYQLHWHLIIANYPVSFGYKLTNSMFAESIRRFFQNELCKKISLNTAEMYVSFLLHNGFFDLLELSRSFTKQSEILEKFTDYEGHPFFLQSNTKQLELFA